MRSILFLSEKYIIKTTEVVVLAYKPHKTGMHNILGEFIRHYVVVYIQLQSTLDSVHMKQRIMMIILVHLISGLHSAIYHGACKS